jgi:four helix bundle protein
MATGLQNLKIYIIARELEIEVYRITKEYPTDEKFRSIDQLRRSSSSVTNNIAEAYNKQSLKEKIHILKDVVICEAEETKSNLELCREKQLANPEKLTIFIDKYLELIKAVNGYIRFLKTDKLIN